MLFFGGKENNRMEVFATSVSTLNFPRTLNSSRQDSKKNVPDICVTMIRRADQCRSLPDCPNRSRRGVLMTLLHITRVTPCFSPVVLGSIDGSIVGKVWRILDVY